MCAHSRYNLTWWVIMDDSNLQAASFLGFLAPPSVFFLSLAPRFCDFSGSVPLISRSITVRSVLHLLCNSVDVRDLIKSVYRILHKYILFNGYGLPEEPVESESWFMSNHLFDAIINIFSIHSNFIELTNEKSVFIFYVFLVLQHTA